MNTCLTFLVNLQNITKKGKEKALKSYMKKSQITYKAKVLRVTADFSAVTERTGDNGGRALQS